MSPAVEQIRKTVEARIRELQPLIAELEQLEGILAALEEPNPSPRTLPLPNISALLSASPETAAAMARHRAAAAEIDDTHGTSAEVRPLVRRGRRGTKPGRDGRAPQGANKQLIIRTILEHPGITAPEVARRTGLKRTVVSATITRLKRSGELEPFDEGVRVPVISAAS